MLGAWSNPKKENRVKVKVNLKIALAIYVKTEVPEAYARENNSSTGVNQLKTLATYAKVKNTSEKVTTETPMPETSDKTNKFRMKASEKQTRGAYARANNSCRKTIIQWVSEALAK